MISQSDHERQARFLGPENLRLLWESHHGSLNESQRKSFLSRPEVPWITSIPAVHVRPAVAKEEKLQRIFALATQGFEREKAKSRAQLEEELARSRAEAKVVTVKKPKNPSRMRLH